MRIPDEPYDSQELYMCFVGEDCPEEYPEEYNEEALNNLYEAKNVYEDMLADDKANKDWESYKLTRERIGQIKAQIKYCKAMMQINKTKEVVTAA